jgi:hypothetical protein
MISLYKHIQESLLSDIDTQLEKGGKLVDAIAAVEECKKWFEHHITDNRFNSGKTPVYNDKTKMVDIHGAILKINQYDAEIFPKNVKLGEVDKLAITEQKGFDACKSNLPSKCKYFTCGSFILKDFEITTEAADLAITEIVNTTLNIPKTRQRSGLLQNYFTITLGHRTDVEQLKINGHGGIIINFDTTPVAETIIKKCRAYVSKLKRSGELKNAQDVNDAILKVIDDELSLSTIDNNWKGIMRIVFRDRGQNFTIGNGIMIVPRLIKPGDLCIQRAPNETQWSVQQRIIKV